MSDKPSSKKFDLGQKALRQRDVLNNSLPTGPKLEFAGSKQSDQGKTQRDLLNQQPDPSPEKRLAELQKELSPEGRAFLDKYIRKGKSIESSLAELEKIAEKQGLSLQEFIEQRGQREAEQRQNRGQNQQRIQEAVDKLREPARTGKLADLAPEARQQELKNHPERRFEIPMLASPDTQNPEAVRIHPERADLQDIIERARRFPPEQRIKTNAGFEAAVKDLRTDMAVEIAVRDQSIATDFPASKGYEVVTNVVLEKEYTSREACTQENPEAKTDPGRMREAPDGKIYFQIGEADIIVRDTRTKEVVLIGEVKSGKNDPPREAHEQIDRVRQAFSEHDAQGPIQDGHRIHASIMTKEGEHTYYTEITDQLDSASIEHAKGRTYGPLDHEFDISLGLTADEIDTIARRCID